MGKVPAPVVLLVSLFLWALPRPRPPAPSYLVSPDQSCAVRPGALDIGLILASSVLFRYEKGRMRGSRSSPKKREKPKDAG